MTTTDIPAQAPDESLRAQPADADSASEAPGFQSRARARRRARFLRKARELAYRDLGGLVFNLHRFGQRNDALVLAKLTTLGHIDAELRAIEDALAERRPLTVLREAGITACRRCAAIHSSEDSFCPNCGLPMGRHVDLPIAGALAPTPAPSYQAAAASQPASSPQTAPSPAAPASAAPSPQTAPSPAAPSPQSAPAAAPSAPAQSAAPAGSAGRSPTPPGASGTGAQPSPPQPSEPASVDDAATEIIHPPISGS